MENTTDLRDKMLTMWAKFEAGEMSGQEARVHIGFARTVLDSIKVEIAAAHLNQSVVPPVSISRARTNGRRSLTS